MKRTTLVGLWGFATFLAGIVGLIPNHAEAQLPDSCVTAHFREFESNPDSIFVDTCLSTREHLVLWVKGHYELWFDTTVIPLGYGAPDSILEVDWQAIDTSFPEVRNLFQSLATNVGGYVLRKVFPDDTSSSTIRSQSFDLIFDDYVPNDSVVTYLDSSAHLLYYLPVSIPVMGATPCSQDADHTLIVFPNPAYGEICTERSGGHQNSTLNLIDAAGDILRTYSWPDDQQTLHIDLHNVPSGQYWIREGDIARRIILR